MRLWALLALALAVFTPVARAAPDELRGRIMSEASDLLEQALVSYVYGGYQVGDSDDCRLCNECLAEKSPAPRQRLVACSVCARCSLDCSHFAARVFDQAGAHYPYLDTATMLSLPARELRRRYGMVDLGADPAATLPGDLLVYDGHVVILERRHEPVADQPRYRGDIVHATGGRAIRRPGEGVQRERFIDITTYHGPLRRVLRHGLLAGLKPSEMPPVAAAKPAPVAAEKAPVSARKLRKIEKRGAKRE